jgi:hypothetical protein
LVYAADERHAGAGAVALVHGDVEALGFEIAAVFGEEEPALRSLILPIQDHLELGFRPRRWRSRGEKAENGDERQQAAAKQRSNCNAKG